MRRRDPDAGAKIERDLNAVRTGERLSYRPALAERAIAYLACLNCGGGLHTHVRQSGILFCSESMLRDRWGV